MRKALYLALGLSALTSLYTQADVTVVMDTSVGEIELQLDDQKAPITVANFVDYAKAGHFDGLVFHRVIPGFMIQGGGMDAAMTPRETRAPIKNESANGLKNDRGTIAMARTNDLNSATSQFFINTQDNPSLNDGGPYGGYAVFGKVSRGMEVVDKISATPTGRKGYHRDVPLEPIVINSVKLAN